MATLTTYAEIQRWLQHYKVPSDRMTDAELKEIYDRKARERVVKLTDDQLKEIFACAARKQPHNVFLVSLASAVVSANDDDLAVLRGAALLYIEKHQL